jgi:hypothetical protein
MRLVFAYGKSGVPYWHLLCSATVYFGHEVLLWLNSVGYSYGHSGFCAVGIFLLHLLIAPCKLGCYFLLPQKKVTKESSSVCQALTPISFIALGYP